MARFNLNILVIMSQHLQDAMMAPNFRELNVKEGFGRLGTKFHGAKPFNYSDLSLDSHTFTNYDPLGIVVRCKASH